MKKETFSIEGMSCQHCTMAVKRELGKLNLHRLEVSIGCAEIDYDETKVSRQQIVAAIAEAGYRVV